MYGVQSLVTVKFRTLLVVTLRTVLSQLMVGLRDFLWSEASQVIQSYGSAVSAYGLIFLGAHFIWAFSLMFLFSGRGYWQELIESIVWAHNKLKLAPAIQPRALSITQGRAVGLAHYLLRGYWYNLVILLSKNYFCRLIKKIEIKNYGY